VACGTSASTSSGAVELQASASGSGSITPLSGTTSQGVSGYLALVMGDAVAWSAILIYLVAGSGSKYGDGAPLSILAGATTIAACVSGADPLVAAVPIRRLTRASQAMPELPAGLVTVQCEILPETRVARAHQELARADVRRVSLAHGDEAATRSSTGTSA
jgi:hypothetical protein